MVFCGSKVKTISGSFSIFRMKAGSSLLLLASM